MQSTPLMSRTGQLLGILTTQWGRPHQPDEHDLWRIDLLVRQAADLIEQVQAEAALRETHERFSTLLQNLDTGVALVDEGGRFVLYNDSFLRIFGLSSAVRDLMDQDWSLWKVFGEDGLLLPLDEHPVRKAALTGKAVRNQVVRTRRPSDGAMLWLLLSAEPILKPDGGRGVIVCTYHDITERKQAEEAVRARERELTEAQRLARLGSWEWDIRSNQVTWSSELCQLLLLDGHSPVPSYTEQGCFYTAESRRRLDVAVEKALRDGTPYELDIEMVRTDGKGLWVTARGEAVRGGSGELEGLRGTVMDITERKQAEAALRESEERFRTLAENNPFIIGRFDRQHRHVYLNQAAELVTGRRVEEHLGKTARELGMPAELCARWESCQDRAFAGERVRQEYEIIDGAGRTRHLWEVFVPEQGADGSVQTVLAISQDVTERVEHERRQAEQARLLDLSKDAIIVRDGADRVTYWNSGAEGLYGYTRQEAMGQVTHELLKTEFRGNIEGIYESLRREKRWEGELIHTRKDGSKVTTLSRWVPDWDSQGRVKAILETNNDISARKEAEQVLARGKEELEKLVAERTAKLHELVGELEHFSYTITHDLKAPLRAMRGFAEMAGEFCDRAEVKEFLGRISTSAERMDRLIADALNYSRTVRQELPLDDVDSGALLRGMLDSYPELQAERARIEVEGRLPVVLGNEAGLTQCFSNLLGNAVKFVKAGEKPEVRVWATSRGEWVRIWVEDKGIGISREMLPRVFEMFSRGSKDHEGTGIGLALVRKVAQRMGGKVGVESEEGKGSRFWIELKTGEARLVSPRVRAGQAQVAGEGTVLYVEDEETDAIFMERAFAEKGLGSKLRLVVTGRAAIEYLSGSGEFGDREKYPVPSLVLLDLNLPQVSGFGVLEWIRNHPDYRRLPVVVFSSSTREDDRTKARELGANEFVTKPSSGLKFGEVVEGLQQRWLGKSRPKT